MVQRLYDMAFVSLPMLSPRLHLLLRFVCRSAYLYRIQARCGFPEAPLLCTSVDQTAEVQACRQTIQVLMSTTATSARSDAYWAYLVALILCLYSLYTALRDLSWIGLCITPRRCLGGFRYR